MNTSNRLFTIIIITGTVLFTACKHAADDYHLPRKDMQRLMMDINLAEAYSVSAKDSLYKPGTRNVDSLSSYYQEIFDHYHITKAQFSQSLNWYKEHPDELDTIYSNNLKIITNLQAHQFHGSALP